MASTSTKPRGCGTCRRRKVRCDLERPECQKCFTTGRTCLGYDQRYSFKVKTKVDFGKRADDYHDRGTCSVTRTETANNEESRPEPQHPLSTGLAQTPTEACGPISECFLRLFLPRYKDYRSIEMLPGGWIHSLPAMFHYRDRTLDRSLLALYAGFVGKREHDPRLAKISVECYIKPFHTLRNSDVWVKKRPSAAEINATLATVLVLSRVELMSGEDGSGGYAAHIRAGLQLLRRPHPSISRDNELTWMLAKRLRCLGFYNAARQRRSFFMAQSPFNEWCFSRPSEPDYLLQKAIDVAISIPTIMEAADALDASTSMSEGDLRRCLRAAKHLLGQAFEVAENLEQWLLETREARLSSSIIQAQGYASTGEAGDCCEENSPAYFDPSSYSLLISWYFCLRIYLFYLVKQLRMRHDALSKLVANPPHLPLHLRTFEQNCATVDRYALSIRRSVTTALTASAFEAQEALVLIFTLYRYWKGKGDDHNALCCIHWLEEIKSRGLAVDVEVDERYAIVTARFMGEHQPFAK